MVLEKQLKESSLPSERMWRDVYDQQVHENIDSNRSGGHEHSIQNEQYFIAKVRPSELSAFHPSSQAPHSERRKNEPAMESFIADKSFSALSELLYDCHLEIYSHACVASTSLNTLQSTEFDSYWFATLPLIFVTIKSSHCTLKNTNC
jgi:hypothetical protein